MSVKKHINCLLSIFSVIILFGCASTKPNTPYAGPYPLSIKSLSTKNPTLVKELGKLPEIQDNISENEKTALELLAAIYEIYPNEFDHAFNEMNKIGQREKRRFCSPLQAIFWLAEERKNDEIVMLIKDYSLVNLLDLAWNFGEKKFYKVDLKLSPRQADEIISRLNKRKQDLFIGVRDEYVNEAILTLYKKNPYSFTRKDRKLIKEHLRDNKLLKWRNFDVVVDRLNAPELIDYYERKRFLYVGHGTMKNPPTTVRGVFKHDKGACGGITKFTVYCLRKNGYKAFEHRVDSYSGWVRYHYVTVFENDGKRFVMDNGLKIGAGIIPWDSFVKRYSIE